MPNIRYSFWLSPNSHALAHIQRIISNLATRQNTVSFAPHLTLFSGKVSSSIDVPSLLGNFAETPAVSLDISCISHSNEFKKTLYLEMKRTDQLSTLVQRLVDYIPDAITPDIDPHVSLLYQHLPVDVRQCLSDTIDMKFSSIRFDKIHVVETPDNFDSQVHVAQLRCVYSQNLASFDD